MGEGGLAERDATVVGGDGVRQINREAARAQGCGETVGEHAVHQAAAAERNLREAARRGRVVAFVGSNLMKFGPLLGDLLAQAVLSDELPDDLDLTQL